MRVTHVITRLIVGGAQENTIASVLGLREKPGLEVTLLSGPTAGSEGSLEHLCRPVPGLLTIIPELVRPIRPLADCMAFRRLTQWFRHARPDIVHTHSGKAGVIGRLAAARAGVSTIIHTIHGPSFGKFQNAFLNNLLLRAERKAAGVTTHFVVVADAMKDQYLAAGIGQEDQYTKILSGFALDRFLSATNDPSLRKRYGLSPDDIVVGKIARLFKLKGHDDLFAIAPDLVRQCPQLKFLLVGDGEWRGRFESRASSLGLQKHFVFAGLVPPQDVPSFIGIMDFVVHLSLREGLARALPQALAAGRPVIAYDCDGAREVCREGETGFLVCPGDLPALTDRILRFVAQPLLRKQFGERGRELVRAGFSVERMVAQLHQLYLALQRQAKPLVQ